MLEGHLKKEKTLFLKNVITSFISLTNKQTLERDILLISQQKVTLDFWTLGHLITVGSVHWIEDRSQGSGVPSCRVLYPS